MLSRSGKESLNSLSGYKDLEIVVDSALRKANLADEPVAYQTVSEVTLPQRKLAPRVFPTPSPVTVSADTNCTFLPPLSLDQYKLNSDPNPEVIRKKPNEKIRYQQSLSVRFLEPPKAPKPGDIVVKQLPNRQIAPAPPLVVRQAPPRPASPSPLILREQPPKVPQPESEKVVFVPGKVIPPPARKVVVERLPTIPPKPQSVLLEKWLPLKSQKRRVVYQRADKDCILPNPRNLVIQWDAPEVEVKREFKNLGTQQANPEEYLRKFSTDLLRHEEFRNAAEKLGVPEQVLNSNSHVQVGLPELEGEVEALKFVNLEKAGLSEYRSYLKNAGISTNSVRYNTGLTIADEASNLISMNQAQNTVNNLNGGTEKLFTENDLRAYFNSLDSNNDGVLSFDELKAAL